jgi:hypothetical protein
MKFNLTILLILVANLAHAHGENKLGPHQGYIRMPGAFHTELVPVNNKQFHIYLMDVGNKNPTIKDSSVKLTYFNNNLKNAFKCTPLKDHFSCIQKKEIDLKKGKLVINAIRLSEKSTDAEYELPLSLMGDM